jgi:CRISPR/Cas system-associated exonuclease Cas4 (RecB family)
VCQLKFYYRYVLGLREKEEVEEDIDSGDLGGFVHDVLRAYFFDMIGREMKVTDVNVGRLLSVVDDQFEQRFGKEMTGARYVLKQQVRKQLRRFLERYQKPLLEQQPITILSLEQKHEIRRGGFLLNGKLDRVERRGEIIYILDYKTGNPDRIRGVELEKLDLQRRDTWKNAIGSLQLPLYAMLYSASTGTPIEKLAPAYLKLGQSAINEKIETRLFDESVMPASGYQQVERVVDELLIEMTNPEIPFSPTESIQKDCTYCPFQPICGTQWAQR